MSTKAKKETNAINRLLKNRASKHTVKSSRSGKHDKGLNLDISIASGRADLSARQALEMQKRVLERDIREAQSQMGKTADPGLYPNTSSKPIVISHDYTACDLSAWNIFATGSHK